MLYVIIFHSLKVVFNVIEPKMYLFRYFFFFMFLGIIEQTMVI